jgi:hypothetical protein
MPDPRRLAAASAVTTAILLFAGQAIAPNGPNEATANPQQIARFLDTSGDAIRLSLTLTTLAAVMLIVFGGAASKLLRAAGADLAARIAPSAAAATAALLGSTAAVGIPLVREQSRGAAATWLPTVYALQDVSDAFGDIAVVTAALLVGTLAVAALRTPVLPRAVGITGAVLAAAGVIAAFAPLDGVSDGPFTVALALFYVIWPVWLLAVGVTLAVRRPIAQSEAPSFAPANSNDQ